MTTVLKSSAQQNESKKDWNVLPSRWDSDQKYQQAKKTLEDTTLMIEKLQGREQTLQQQMTEADEQIRRVRVLEKAGRASASEVSKLRKSREDLEENLLQTQADLLIARENLDDHEKDFNRESERAKNESALALVQREIALIERLTEVGALYIEIHEQRIELYKYGYSQFDPANDKRLGLRDHFLYSNENPVMALRWEIRERMDSSQLKYYQGLADGLKEKLNVK